MFKKIMDVKHTFVILSAVTFGVFEDLESTRKKECNLFMAKDSTSNRLGIIADYAR